MTSSEMVLSFSCQKAFVTQVFISSILLYRFDKRRIHFFHLLPLMIILSFFDSLDSRPTFDLGMSNGPGWPRIYPSTVWPGPPLAVPRAGWAVPCLCAGRVQRTSLKKIRLIFLTFSILILKNRTHARTMTKIFKWFGQTWPTPLIRELFGF